jgi:hypothetical protein
MYTQKLNDGTWKKLIGDVIFSPTVYQTAESLTDEQRAEFDVHFIHQMPKPNVDYIFNVTEADPEFKDGNWFQVWVVSDASPDEVEQRTNNQAASVRAERNSLIAECDWTQLPDSPLTTTKKQEWSLYRQTLRDITSQSVFPWNVVWPNKPE